MAATRGRTGAGSSSSTSGQGAPAGRTRSPRPRVAPVDDGELDVEVSGEPAAPRSRPRPAATASFFKQKTAYEIGTGDWSSDVCSSDRFAVAPAARAGGRRVPLLSLLVAAIVAVVALAGLVLAELHIASSTSANDNRASAVAAARAFANSLASYDYNSVDQDFQAVLDKSTGEFKQKFSSSSAAQQAKIVKFQATATGTVYDAAATDVTSDRATVLVFVDQRVTNTSLQAPAVEKDRLRLTLVRSGNDWLVSRLETF